jgi:hypothetical protein
VRAGAAGSPGRYSTVKNTSKYIRHEKNQSQLIPLGMVLTEEEKHTPNGD